MRKKQDIIHCNRVEWVLQNGNRIFFTVARLDRLHPVVSGNKYFKLKYNIDAAIRQNKKGIITMGGPYSNHLAATAFTCREAGITPIGIVRGEVKAPLNHTLAFCSSQGMQLVPCERNEYDPNSKYVRQIISNHPNYFFIPQGGDNAEGLKGCEEILHHIRDADFFRYILCSIGTGTTFRGLATAAKSHQTVIGIPVLKIKENEQSGFLQKQMAINTTAAITVLFQYAGKGYAKQESHLFSFMNRFYRQTGIPLDFVYTAKLLYACIELAEKNYFEKDTGILVLHTGGLQGNESLPVGTIEF